MHVDSIEISTTDHCNLSCAQCNHASPYLRKRFTDIATVEHDLRTLANCLSAGELRIAGGEPLLHPDLEGLIDVVRQSRISERIVVITNGVLLHRYDFRFLRDIDELRVSVYPNVHYGFDTESLRRTCRSFDVKLSLRPMNSFSRTMLTKRNDNSRLVDFIYRNCALIREWSCHLVHEGRFYKCTPSAFMQDRLALAGIAHDSRRDGIDLHGGDLGRRIRAYIDSDEPLAACAYCLGTVGRRIGHRQLSKRQLQSALAEDNASAIASIGLTGLADSLVLSRLRKTNYYSIVLRTLNAIRKRRRR